MSRPDRQALKALFLHGWRQAAATRATTVGRIVLLVLILLIFWAMWNATPLGELGVDGPTAAQMLWYLAATETVALSVGFPYRIVEAEIHNGEIATHFLRPLHYVSAMLATWLGEMTHRFLAIVAAAAIIAELVTGAFVFQPATAAILVVGLWIACTMLLVSQLCIGLLATWMKSAAPAFWVWQKLFFVLGGLMFPLTIYPDWLTRAAMSTPFPSMLFMPASLVFDSTLANVALMFASQAVWLSLLILLATFLYSRMNAYLTVHGV